MTRTVCLALAALLALAACGNRQELLVGERVDLRGEVDATVDRAAPISLPAATNLGAWSQKASGPAHSIPHASLPSSPALRFAVPIGQGETRRHRITADPVSADGRVYTVDSRTQVAAHTTGGQRLWQVSAAPAGEAIESAAGAGLAVSGGTLFVATAFGDVIALDAATGRRLWTQDIGAPAAGAPTVSGGTVYVVGRDATAWAIDASNGRVRWTEQGTPSQSGVNGGAAPAVSGNLVVLPFASRELHGVLAEGGTGRWVSNVAGTRLGRVYASIGDVSGDPVIVGDTVYAGSPSGRINALSLTNGSQLWSAEEGAMSPVLVAGGSVFAVSDQAELVRLDASDGSRIWGTELPFFKRNAITRRQAVFAHYGPILAGGRLWVASSDERLRAFDPTSGRLVAELPLPGGAASNPIVVGGTLYVVTKDGQLLAYR